MSSTTPTRAGPGPPTWPTTGRCARPIGLLRPVPPGRHRQLAELSWYQAVAATVRAVVTEGKFQLIETAAERVAERLLADYRLGWVRVEVAKPLPAEGYTAVVAIERGSR